MFNKAKKTKRSNKVVNEEGYTVYKMRDDQALFLEGSSFLPRNSYYKTIEERLINFETLIERNTYVDKTYVLALAYFLGKTLGIRLSPILILMKTLMVSRLETKEDYLKVQKIVMDVFTRPDFISHAFSYWKYKNNNIKNFQAFIYQVARNSIADYYKKTKDLQLPEESDSIMMDKNLIHNIDNSSDWQILDKNLRELGKINGKWQEVIMLKHIEGYSIKEISKIINESSANTRVLIHRAMEKLKELMGE